MKTLTVSEATKKLPTCLDRVYRRHESFKVVKNGIPYAHLVPANGTGCTTHEFADDLAEAELTAADRRVLASAIRRGRKQLKPLKNPWGDPGQLPADCGGTGKL